MTRLRIDLSWFTLNMNSYDYIPYLPSLFQFPVLDIIHTIRNPLNQHYYYSTTSV